MCMDSSSLVAILLLRACVLELAHYLGCPCSEDIGSPAAWREANWKPCNGSGSLSAPRFIALTPTLLLAATWRSHDETVG